MSRGFRGLPPRVRRQLQTMASAHSIEVGGVQSFTAEELRKGRLVHLGIDSIASTDTEIVVIPPATVGIFSNKNVNGYQIVRRDLPKETHYNYVETPNWGDVSRGTHIVALPYEKYPRDLIAPRLAAIEVTRVGLSENGATVTLKFRTSEVFDRASKTFEQDLLEAINFLNENTDCFGVAPHGTPAAEYLKELRVSWEILPPGSRDDVVARLFRGRAPSDEERKTVEERYEFLIALKPEKLIIGTSGLQRYFGALIAHDRVVFENIVYGNAIYVMYDDWKELSQRSRTELLSGRWGKNFVRIVHSRGWKTKVREAIEHRPGDPPEQLRLRRERLQRRAAAWNARARFR